MKKVTCFFQQLIQRLKASTPPFFKIVRNLSGLVAIITGVLSQLQANNVVLPEPLQLIADKTAMWCAIIGGLIAQSATNDPNVLTTFKQEQSPEQAAKAAATDASPQL